MIQMLMLPARGQTLAASVGGQTSATSVGDHALATSVGGQTSAASVRGLRHQQREPEKSEVEKRSQRIHQVMLAVSEMQTSVTLVEIRQRS